MKVAKAKFGSCGGIHPEYNKHLAAEKPVKDVPIAPLLTVSMSQHLGAPALPSVAKGDSVLKGQVIGEAGGFISAAVHAPTSGTVKDIAPAPTVAGQTVPAVIIESDGEDNLFESEVIGSWEEKDAKALVGLVADAGVVGMGGAGFPTHVKLSPPPGNDIDTLIINGAECEPYLTADYRLMVEQASNIANGIKVIRKILGAQTVRVAIEDNKPEAIKAMEQAMTDMDGDVEIAVLKTEYPQGAEKQQIYAITGREVPSAGLPMAVGCVVENVGTTAAVWNAVTTGAPLIERITAVTGNPLGDPCNLNARIGTPFSQMIEMAGGITGEAAKIICGGPMMGFAHSSLDVTTSKTTSGLLILSPKEARTYSSMACISCGRCIDHCPMSLMPSELSQFIEAEDYESAEDYNVLDCIECGCCAFECPAMRPLVQHMRRGKAEVMAIVRARKEEEK